MSDNIHQYYIVNKPYNMVSQFISPHNVRLLCHLNFNFPEGTHAIGRLDKNSEGLLILTTNKKLTRLLFQDSASHTRTYLAEVNNILSEESLHKLQTGVTFKIKGDTYYQSVPTDVVIISKAFNLFPLAIMQNKRQLTSWLQVTLTEGKYHQVRKMIGAVRHRCLRLIRISIEDLTLNNMQPGEVVEIEEAELFSKLNIEVRNC